MKTERKRRRASEFFTVVAIVLALFRLSQSACAAQEKENSFALTFSPQPGQTLIYNLNTRMNSEGKSFLGKSLSLSATASGEIDLSIRQVSKEDVFTELTTPGIQVSLQALENRDEFTLTASKDNPVQVVFDKTGRIRDVKNVEALEEQNIMNFSVVEVLRNYLPAFPDARVSVGDSWKDHKRMLIPFQGMNLVVELDVIFVLNDVLPSPEGRMALISASYTVALSGSRDLGEAVGSFEGNGFGSGSMNFLMGQGYVMEYRLDYSIDGALVVRQAEAKLLEWPFRLSVSASLSLMEKH